MAASSGPNASLQELAVCASLSAFGTPSVAAMLLGPNPLPHNVQTLGNVPTHPTMATAFTPKAEGAADLNVTGWELLGISVSDHLHIDLFSHRCLPGNLKIDLPR